MGESVLTLLVLSWLAGAARAQYARERPRCRSANCTDPEYEDVIATFTLYQSVPVFMEFKENQYFVMRCGSPLGADDAALPAAPRAVTVDLASVIGCRAPRSYAAALAKLNVTAAHTLKLSLLPNEPALANHHLAGLTVSALEIYSYDLDVDANLTGSFLADLKLRDLVLTSVTLSVDVLKMLPDSLERLRMNVAFETTGPLSLLWMTRLTSLRSLIVAVHSENVPPLTPPPLSQFPLLTELALSMPLSLPRNWLNGSALTMLSLDNCQLTELHEDMFLGVNLTILNLAGNNLTELPERVLSPLRWLTALDVSDNSLRGAVLWRAAARLPALAALRAGGNPLGAACPEDQGLSAPSTLTELQLGGTGATRVCAAWTAARALVSLDLSDNSIASLSYQDMKVTAGAEREVLLDLRNNPLRAISVSPSDLAACREDKDQHAKVRLTVTALQCDCSNALLAELLRACAARLALARPPQCAPLPCAPPPCAPPAAPRSLLAARRDQLLCACPAAFNFSVPGCSCSKRLLDNATVVQCSSIVVNGTSWPPASSTHPLALHVAGAGLAAVPRAALVELHAANNTIPALRAEDISDTLLVLDLRNNSIAHISVEAARRLGTAGPGGAPRSVWLGANPLACGCSDRAAVELLKSAEVQAQLRDWKELRCSDGRELSALSPSELCPITLVPTLLIAGIMMLFLLVLALVMIRWLKRFLFDPEFSQRPEHTVDDPNKTHDAFISNAVEDHEVAAKLLWQLEQRGYSAVERSRDWEVGLPVAELITGSLLCARRTILLVSDNYIESPWGLQEFRAARAHAAERRSAHVLPVLCGLSSPRVLPEDLRVYLYNNTYLSWDDPDFWEKLWRAMPPPRAPARQAPATAASKPAALEQLPLQPRPGPRLLPASSHANDLPP